MREGGETSSGFEYLESLASSADRGNEGEKGFEVCGGVEKDGFLEVDVGEIVVELVEGVAEESSCFFWSKRVWCMSTVPLAENYSLYAAGRRFTVA